MIIVRIHFGSILNSVCYFPYLVHFLSTIYFGVLVNEGYDTQRKGKRKVRMLNMLVVDSCVKLCEIV